MSQYTYALGKDLKETVMTFFFFEQAFLGSRRSEQGEPQGGSGALAVGDPKTWWQSTDRKPESPPDPGKHRAVHTAWGGTQEWVDPS